MGQSSRGVGALPSRRGQPDLGVSVCGGGIGWG